MNKVILLGFLTRDVELRYLPSGSAVATIGLAINRRYKKQDGSQGEEVCFVDAKLFGRTAEIANQYLRKGSKALIEGRLAFETWEKNGQKYSKHFVLGENLQMLDNKQEANQSKDSKDQDDLREQYKNAPTIDMSEPTPQSNQNTLELQEEIPF